MSSKSPSTNVPLSSLQSWVASLLPNVPDWKVTPDTQELVSQLYRLNTSLEKDSIGEGQGVPPVEEKKEETGASWMSWLLDAIHKIKYQKQRPNVEMIAACIRQHHPQYSNETVFQVGTAVQYQIGWIITQK